jgi:3'-phosphoadenosine 5'-phosphosulfate sulfotransferase (PAPS reductase)/FAD synthetase
MTPEHARLHAKLAAYRARVTDARTLIRRAMDMCSAPYVACSFGKDSAVLLHLMLSLYPQVDARFLRWRNETEHLDTYDAIIAQWNEQYPGLRLTVVELERESLSHRVRGRFGALECVQPSDAVLIGLRAEESRGRRLTLRTHGTIYRMASGILRVCPLAWWSTADIAAYTVTHDLPVLSAYQEYGFTARTSSRIPREAHGIRSASLAALRRDHPDRFAALQASFPEVSAYV